MQAAVPLSSEVPKHCSGIMGDLLECHVAAELPRAFNEAQLISLFDRVSRATQTA